MSATVADLAPTFTPSQLAAIVEWSVSRPLGLAVTIQRGPEGLPEMAEIGRGLTPSRYEVRPIHAGMVTLTTAFGPGWAWANVEAALAWVAQLERARLGLEK